MKAKPIIIATIIVAVLGVSAWFIYKKRQEKELLTKDETKGNESGMNPATQLPTFPLKNGSRGEEVKALQRWLNTNLTAKYKQSVASSQASASIGKIGTTPGLLTVDGIFGAATAVALKTITGKDTMDKAYYDNAKIANA